MAKKVVLEHVNSNEKGRWSISICEGAIPGAIPYYHKLENGNIFGLDPGKSYFRILYLIEGKVTFETKTKSCTYNERVCYVPGLEEELTIKALSDAGILEIQWNMNENDLVKLQEYKTEFPLITIYSEAKQYTDPNKSEKTISRSIIEQRKIPRFATGSVETYGYDIVRPHSHPTLDQFFFSFPENDMDLLIDGAKIPMAGNVFMHIPLGSEHGVEASGSKHVHYLWIDFMENDEGLKRLDVSHKFLDTMRSFDNGGK